MKTAHPLSKCLFVALPLLAVALTAQASTGLATPTADMLWPQWQARITVQTAAAQRLPGFGLSALSPRLGSRESAGAQGGVQGAAVLGDYTFARLFFGSFRASGGLMMGTQGGAPGITSLAGPSNAAVGSSVLFGAGTASGVASDNTVPYLGLGFSGAAWHNSLSVMADLGLVSGRPSAARALFGNQGAENALREMRLSPVLQVGVRYSF
jgi:hypothetical protein